jgi:hypothetical protein
MAKRSSKKAVRRPAAKRRKTVVRPRGVEFSSVRKVARRKIQELKRLEQTPEVIAAIGRMEECVAQVTQICGDDMLFPVR